MLPEGQHCFSNARKRPSNRENTLRSVAENKRSAYLNGGITGEWCSYHPINYEIFSTVMSMLIFAPDCTALFQLAK